MLPVAIIQNCEVEGPGNVVEYLEQNSIEYSITHSYKNEPLPGVDETKAIISLGCPLSFLECQKHQFLKKLFELTEQAVQQDKPFLGICFGSQVLAAAMGARVFRNPVKEIGITKLQLTEAGAADPLFADFEREFPVFQWHGDTFDLPAGTALLDASANCRNQAFRKGNLVGLQFHLEADEKKVPAWCEAYVDELAGEGIDEKDLIADYNAVADSMSKLSFKLLDNFFSL